MSRLGIWPVDSADSAFGRPVSAVAARWRSVENVAVTSLASVTEYPSSVAYRLVPSTPLGCGHADQDDRADAAQVRVLIEANVSETARPQRSPLITPPCGRSRY